MGADQSQLMTENVKQNSIGFFINGKEYNVQSDFDKIGPQTLLVDFIRDVAGLKGTKYNCREGGCGVCVVSVKSKDPSSGKDVIRSVNSCLIPVFCCDGWDITTIEKLGNKHDGYHKLQNQMVKFSGTQCGFCSPGMLMNMHSLCESKKQFKAQDVEDHFDGNICRCTGYRPILDAFKSIAVDASEELKRKCAEIEDCAGCPCKPKNGNCSTVKCCGSEDFENCKEAMELYLRLKSGEEWVRPTSMNALFEAISRFQSAGMRFRLIGGNTGTGVYKYDGPYQAYIDVNNIPDLRKTVLDSSGVVIGASVTLTALIELLQKAGDITGFKYAEDMATHLKRVANTPVRNAATWSGNLMLKHAHKEFPSDVFLLLETVGAKLNIASSPTVSREYSPLEFLDLDMNDKVIVSFKLRSYGNDYYFRSFKITKRYQNAHAYVNAGFLMQVDPRRNFSIRDKPNIVYGGISPSFVHASQTEMSLLGKFLNKDTLQKSLDALEKEIEPENKPPDASPAYRKGLAEALFYKFVLGIMGDSAQEKLRSGAKDIERGLNYGKQTYEVDKTMWPLYKPMPKLEAKAQVSGEAEYINDINPEFGELNAAFVLSTEANASIKNIDPSEALLMPGVVSFIQAKDVPGLNNYMVFYPQPEEIFAVDKVKHAGQALGLIVAETREQALAAARKVEVLYDNIQKPVLDIKKVMEKAEKEGKMDELIFELKKSSIAPEAEPAHVLKGEFRSGSQFHFPMETQTCICVPKEDSMDVYSASQWMDFTQAAVAASLGIGNNEVNVVVRRLGGGFGCKISRSVHVATACAVAAQALRKPVRIVMDLESNMRLIGKRLPYYSKYEAGVDNDGNIVSMKIQIFCDPGYVPNESTSVYAAMNVQNTYRAKGWEVVHGKALTNTPANTYCRAPGSTPAIALIENIMEHIAHELKMDPLDVRVKNLIQDGDDLFFFGQKFTDENLIPKMIEDMKSSADYEDRKKFVENYNKEHRWKKRGLGIVPMRYPTHYVDFKFPVFISVSHVDGTVSISHCGIEMGQGINTKVAQVVAYEFGIPVDKIKVKPANSFISPNATLTGGATTSEMTCYSAMYAAKELMGRMDAAKKKLKDPTWEQLVAQCYKDGMRLTSQFQPKTNDVLPYNVWGLTLTEVEIDVLTGEYKIVRLDMIEDAGKSLSPEIDIGQLEGSVVMGLGLWLTEKIVHDQNNGQLLTHGTWEYKPPLPKDIPEDLRITMLKNAKNPIGVLNSKATGEPPMCMMVAVLFAMRNAINSARKDAGNTDWYQMDGPINPEDIMRLSLTNKDQFEL